MWSPFQKLIGRNAPSDKAPTAARRNAGTPLAAPLAQRGAGNTPASSTTIQADPSLDRQFILFLLGISSGRERPCNAPELALLERLTAMVQQIGGQTLVPRLPAALPKLMGLIRRDDVSGREMADHLARDPALLGEVIRIANSASYRSARPVQSVEDAVAMLGQRGLDQEDPQTPPHDALVFHDALHRLGQQLSTGIARQWEFPEAVVGALDQLATDLSTPPESTLAAAIYSADKLAKRLLHPMQESADAHAVTAVDLQCWEDLQRNFPAP